MGTHQKSGIADFWKKLNEPVPLGLFDRRVDLGFLDLEIPLPGLGPKRRRAPRLRYQRNQKKVREIAKGTSGDSFKLEGRIRVGKGSQFAIGADDFVITGDTWIVGDIALNAHARVRGVYRNGDERHATSVIVTK